MPVAQGRSKLLVCQPHGPDAGDREITRELVHTGEVPRILRRWCRCLVLLVLLLPMPVLILLMRMTAMINLYRLSSWCLLQPHISTFFCHGGLVFASWRRLWRDFERTDVLRPWGEGQSRWRGLHHGLRAWRSAPAATCRTSRGCGCRGEPAADTSGVAEGWAARRRGG